MPPRSSLTSSFSITDANNEVVCPLRNQDGSSCRKRCIGEKRYRSMQEHIRRAHPEHYIAKLPATEESFLLMINSTPTERPQAQNQSQHKNTASPQPSAADSTKGYPHDRHAFFRNESRHHNDHTGASQLPAASAAAALAQLGGRHKFDSDWDSEPGWYSDSEGRRRIPQSSIELPPIHYSADPTSEPFPPITSAPGRRELLPSILSNSPPGRSSTLPPLQRSLGFHRARKQSITKRGHRKQRSRGTAADWLRRIQNDEGLSPGGAVDRKAHSVEPSVDYGKRWEDLIDAAASATEDIDDRTPVSIEQRPCSSLLTCQVPQSPPSSIHRASLPPFSQHYFRGHQASPLQQALTPPPFPPEIAEPFPSVESGASVEGFHMATVGLSASSPSYSTQEVHIYCAACQRTSKLRESYACTECICGFCRDCVNILMEEQGAQRKCPRCATIGGRYKPFQLDIR